MPLLIENANIITMDEPAEIVGGHILIVDGIIRFVGKEVPRSTAFPEHTTTFDAQNAIVLPGFVNAHTHVPMTLLRGVADDLSLHDWLFNHIFPREAEFTPADIARGTEIAIDEMLASGTTCFCDMYFMELEVAKVTAKRGIRAVLGRSLACKETDIDFSNEQRVLEAHALHEFCQNYDKLETTISPHAIYTSSPEYLKYCSTLGNHFHVHISETIKENEDCLAAHGKTPTQLLATLGYFQPHHVTNIAHGVHLTDEDIAIIAASNSSVTHCPSSNLKLASGIAPIQKYLDNGINVALGTDGAASNNALNMLNEIRLAALLSKGVTLDPTAISAQAALEMATINGAKALGLDHIIGKIKTGYSADLVFFETKSPNMQPLPTSLASAIVYSADRANITHTMVAGEFLHTK